MSHAEQHRRHDLGRLLAIEDAALAVLSADDTRLDDALATLSRLVHGAAPRPAPWIGWAGWHAVKVQQSTTAGGGRGTAH